MSEQAVDEHVDTGDGKPDPLEILQSGGSARIAAEQLVGMLQSGLQNEIECRLDWLNQRLDALASKLDGVLDGKTSENSDVSVAIADGLIENGLLEEVVTRVVDRRIGEGGGEGGSSIEQNADELKRLAGELLKDFLSENLSALFQKEIKAVVEKEVHTIMAGDDIKMLIDDKFRAVTLYLKTEVIPKAVRQALNED